MHSLAYHHLFADGNKRTAVQAVRYFLELNGYMAMWTQSEAEQYVLEVAQDQRSVEEIADWLRGHVQKIPPES